MGIVSTGIPDWCLKFARNHMDIDLAIETGTYLGESALKMSEFFSKVKSVEADRNLYLETLQRLSNAPGITLYNAESLHFLREIELHEPALFWLDAHYSGGATYGSNSQCPLIEELEILGQKKLNERTVILVDDVRLFCLPHDLSPNMVGWPSLSNVMNIFAKHEYSTFICDDVMIAIRPAFNELFFDFVMNELLWLPNDKR